MEERLQKYLSAMGICSRRKAEEWIAEGRVRINGNKAALGDKVDPSEDIVEVDGTRVQAKKQPRQRYLMLHKPRGYVTTLSDEQGRPTVLDLISDCGCRVYPIGRLDYYSEGLLLLTNDGELANALMHPKHEVNKTYLAWTSEFREDALEQLRKPIEIDGRMITAPEVQLKSRKGSTACWEVTIHEGRNRQVRRMFSAADLKVTRLKRIGEGTMSLGDLPLGKWRELTEEEVRQLKKETGKKEE